MSPADMPDFDKMSPEEINEWLESLAKRQGATEGFTTDASMEIAEIDPDTVVIDEPGYVPFGEESSSRKPDPTPAPPPQPEVVARPVEPPPAPVREPLPSRETPPAAPPKSEPRPTSPPWDVERPAAAKAPATAPAARPVEPPPSPVRSIPATPPPRPEVRPAPAASIPETKPVQAPLPSAPAASAPASAGESVDAGALAWLESLAAEQGDDLFNLDLSGVSLADEPAPAVARGLDNPMTWLEDLARSQTGQELPSLQLDRLEDEIEEGSEKIDPFASGANPVEWLETLARREGVDTNELTTRARLNIPSPDADAVEAEAYTPFSFDSPLSQPRIVDEDKTPVNPNDFLTTLAGDEGYSESGVRATAPLNEAEEFDDQLSMDSIQSAISGGTVTPDQMQFFLDQKAEELASNPDMLIFGDEDEEDEPLIAEIPDWLQDMRPSEPEAAPPKQSLESLFEVQAENLDIPDWLRAADEESHAGDITGIFADEDEPEPVISAIGGMPNYSVEVDPNDPWVEAFDLEHEQGAQDIDVVPDWYDRNINDPDRIAAVERHLPGEEIGEALVEAPLPAESSLPLGQPQSVPAWLVGFDQSVAAAAPVPTPAPVQETPFTSDMPDWLKEIEVPDDVPDWLVETFPEAEVVEEEPVQFEPEPVRVAPAPAAPPRPAAPPAPKPTPAPRVTMVSDEEAMTRLQSARDLEQAGDLETSLSEYEGLIRANRAIDVVVDDLTQLLRSYRTVPAVYRVLGDGLMRQGKLQAALNTYREALNQL